MQHLPVEILLNHVLSYLDVLDVLSCSEVSQNFYLLCQDQLLWKQLFQQDFNSRLPLTSKASQMLDSEGYLKLYQYYHLLTRKLFIALELRTEESDTWTINDSKSIAHSIMYFGTVVFLMRVNDPMYVSIDRHKKSFTCGMFVLNEDEMTYHNDGFDVNSDRRVGTERTQWTLQTLEDSLNESFSQGYFCSLKRDFNSEENSWFLDTNKEETKEFVDFGLVSVDLEELESIKKNGRISEIW